MYNAAMYQQANIPNDAMYHQHMLPSGSAYPGNMSMPMTAAHSGVPSAYSQADMSSHVADASIDTANQDDDADGGGKRRRVQRACDTCRKKKVRCDGLQPDKGACSNCANYGYECTFVDAARKRAPPRSYVEAIEARIVKMEQLIASLAPGVDFTDRIGKPIRRPDEKGDDISNDATNVSPTSKADLSVATAGLDAHPGLCGPGTASLSQMLSPSHKKSGTNSESDLTQSPDEDSEDDIAFIESRFGDVKLHQNLDTTKDGSVFDSMGHERLIVGEGSRADSVDRTSQVHKFIGKASAMHSLPIIERLSSRSTTELGIYPKGARPEFWDVPLGLLDPPGDPAVTSSAWPDEDLAIKLIDAYFGRSNRDYPIVNEAEFRHEYENRPELRKDPEWLALSFSIFMVGSQFVSDKRVLAFPEDPHSRGTQWWQAAKTLSFRNYRQQKPLHTIQVFLLATIFQMSIPISASTSWLMLGGAIRFLLDIGAHRKNAAKKLALSLLEEEAYKRNFWVAYSLDRETASNLGRPLMLQDEDIDVELPLEIDDEYLFNAAPGGPIPTQPAGQPAIISGFLCSLRLDEIVGRTLKTVYALQKTKARFGIQSKDWDERLVTEIDSALNNWLDTVPSHLRYDPHEIKDEWLMQSSLLYSKYYNTQILVHRPFIPAKKGASETSILNFPSLAICTNAARSISHLIQNLKDRELQNEVGISVAFRSVSASSILLMVVWGAKRNGGRVSSSASTDLRRSIDVLRSMEPQWQFAGKAVDILESIMNMTHVSIPRSASQSEQGTKRTRDGLDAKNVKTEDDSMLSVAPKAGEPTDVNGKGKRKSAGRVSAVHSGNANGEPMAPEARHLPLSTQQLATIDSYSNAGHSPQLANDTNLADMSQQNQPLVGDSFGPKTPQPNGRARMSSFSANNAGVPASLSFGLLSPSNGQWPASGMPDYMQGPNMANAQFQTLPAMTPSIFDSLVLPGSAEDIMSAGVPDMNGVYYGAPSNAGMGDNESSMFGGFDRFFPNAGQTGQAGADDENSHSTTPQSDGSSGLANYAFELLQKQSVWNLDGESLNMLQQRTRQ